MAIRVQTKADILFGNAAAEVVVTHVRIRESDDSNPIVHVLPNSITIAAGAPMRIPTGLLDVVYPSGALTNDHMRELINGYWDDGNNDGTGTKSMEIDLMTDANTPVADSGYAQQTVNDWAISAEAD